MDLELVTTANYNITVEVRLYRDATLLNTKLLNRSGATAGTEIVPLSGTYVDTAPAAGTVTYEVRVIVTDTTNITSSNAVNNNLNVVTF